MANGPDGNRREAGRRHDPLLGYRFQVEFDFLVAAGFSEITGLGMELETEDYQEGGENRFVHKLPVRYTHSNLTLERGVTDNYALWDWFHSARYGPVERKLVSVYLLDESDKPDSFSRGWDFANAYPVRWTGPDFQADQGAVAIESLELAHEGVYEVQPP